MSVVEAPNIEYIILSSGREITIIDPDFSLLKTERDMIKAKYEFAARSVDIETNIEFAKLGRNHIGKQFDPFWLAKANKALSFAKLNQHVVDQLLVMFRADQKDKKEREFCQSFVDVARVVLDQETFDDIRRIADLGEKAGAIIEIRKSRALKAREA